MNLSKLLPWNWFHQPAGLAAPDSATAGGGLKILRAGPDGEEGPAPGSVEAVHHELSRLFDHGFDGLGLDAPHLAMDELGDPPAFFPPRTRSTSTEDRHIFEADLPGVREEDIALTLRGHELTVRAPRPPDHSGGSAPGRAAYRPCSSFPPTPTRTRSRPASSPPCWCSRRQDCARVAAFRGHASDRFLQFRLC